MEIAANVLVFTLRTGMRTEQPGFDFRLYRV